jgi:hypothetical protein
MAHRLGSAIAEGSSVGDNVIIDTFLLPPK